MTRTLSPLFRPLSIRSLELPNRIVMSPMTRSHSPGGVPGADVAEYYRRRAAGGTGLIITEGTAIEHATAVDNPLVPRMYGDDALELATRGRRGPRRGRPDHPPAVARGPPLGRNDPRDVDPALTPMKPSGVWGKPGVTSYSEDYVAQATQPCRAMTDEDIADTITAYTQAARNAREVGFDGIALHGGHGYLLDSFLWDSTNQRDDEWGGDLERRTRYPSAVVASIRNAIGDDAPIFFRFSQHKQQDYTAQIAQSPDELKTILTALVDAGVDVFDASIRRFDAPVFDGSDLSLAGWAKKLTGVTSMAVGSVGIGASLRESMAAGSAPAEDNIPELERRLSADEFDLAAIGRLHLADPTLATTLREGSDLPEFDRAAHATDLI